MTGRRSMNMRGVTLVELLVVMVMMGVVATAMFSLYQDTGRSSRSEEDVVELQQILRTALDQIAADIRMAGFMVSSDFAPLAVARTVNPVNGAIVANPFPVPPAATPYAMHFLMRTGSAQARVVRLEKNSSSLPGSGSERTLDGISADQLSQFRPSGEYARVYRAATSDQPLTKIFNVSLSPATGTPEFLKLTTTDGSDLNAVGFQRGDIVCQVFSNTPAGILPEMIAYTTQPIAKMPAKSADAFGPALDAAINILRVAGYCKTANCFPLATGYIASTSSQIGTQPPMADLTGKVVDINFPRITRLTFTYIRRDDSEAAVVADSMYGTTANSALRNIVAIRVTIAGQTPSGKRRELSTVVRLMNRDFESVKEE